MISRIKGRPVQSEATWPVRDCSPLERDIVAIDLDIAPEKLEIFWIRLERNYLSGATHELGELQRVVANVGSNIYYYVPGVHQTLHEFGFFRLINAAH
jgi:hypothetical protein